MGQHILVVDDDELICDLVRETLSFDDYQVEAAYSGEQALVALAQSSFDLVLLDIMMAGIDGFETYCRMLRDKRLYQIPVIFLTANSQFEHGLPGLSKAAPQFIAKPFHPLSLAPILQRTLEHESGRSAEERQRQRKERLELFACGLAQVVGDSVDSWSME